MSRSTLKPAALHLVSVEETAERYGISPQNVRRMISDGRLRAYRVGKKLIRIDLAEADAVLLRPIPTVGTFAANGK